MDLPNCCLTGILAQPVWLNHFGFGWLTVMVGKYHWMNMPDGLSGPSIEILNSWVSSYCQSPFGPHCLLLAHIAVSLKDANLI